MGIYLRGTVYYYRFKISGQEFKGSCKTTIKAEAEACEEARRRDAYEAMFLKASNGEKKPDYLLSEAYKRLYNEKWRYNKDGEKSYRQGLRVCDLLDDPYINDMTPSDISKLRDALVHLDMKTINRYLANLKTVLRKAYYEWELIDKLPKISLQAEEEMTVTVSRKQEKNIIEWFTSQGEIEMADLTAALIDTGMRLSELLTLTCEQVEEGRVKLLTTKNKTSRNIPLFTDRAKEVLARRCAEASDDNLFTYNIDKAERKWQAMRKALKLGSLRMHALRHTTGTRLIDKGMDVTVVKKILGHKSLQTTQRYVNLSDRNITDATDRLDGQL